MHQNKKIFLTALMICCVVIMGFSRFGWGESQVYGAAMFANPFAGLALLCMLLGIWLGGNQTMRMVSVFGSFLLVACELYFAATWYIQGVLDLWLHCCWLFCAAQSTLYGRNRKKNADDITEEGCINWNFHLCSFFCPLFWF